MNRVILVGYVGKDPEIRTTQSGKEIAKFSLATKERWNDNEHTEWHRVVVLNVGLVKLVKSYVQQGTLLGIEGQLKTRKYQDQQGKDCFTTEIIIPSFTGMLTMLGRQK